MNYYYIIFRLDSDNRFSRRLWEDFADSREDAIRLLAEYCLEKFFPGDLFPPKLVIIRLDEYLSVFPPRQNDSLLLQNFDNNGDKSTIPGE